MDNAFDHSQTDRVSGAQVGGRNTVRSHGHFRHKALRFSVSSRRIRPAIDAEDYLETYYYFLDVGQIESVFGTCAAYSPLYGGWGFNEQGSLTDGHVSALERLGIGVSLTMTNHFFSDETYRQSLNVLGRHHREGNSIICTNDELAIRIRNDFPRYHLKASLIKGLDTHSKIARALDIYDVVVLPMNKNDDDAFLEGIEVKARILLFGNAGCAYNCPARTCYLGKSQKVQGRPVTMGCSKEKLPRPDLGYIVFDVEKLSAMGFTRFKLIPPRTLQLRSLLDERGWPFEDAGRPA